MANRFRKFPFTQQYLRSRLHYSRKTGIFTWRYHAVMPAGWNTKYAGTEAGSSSNTGHINIGINGRLYKAHRLAWFYVYGEQPPEVDHENLNEQDNSLDNLRAATFNQNQHNRTIQNNNTSGYKGVTRHKNKWYSQISVGGHRIYLGVYSTPEAASEAYIAASKKYHKNFARWE